MTSLSMVPASDLTPGQRFRYLDHEHTVTRIEPLLEGVLLDIHVDDRDAPVTLLRYTPITLLEGGPS